MSDEAVEPTCSIVWWGHSAASVLLDGVQFITDPLLRRRIGPLHWVGHRPEAREVATTDVVLLSHLHRDHTDLPSLRRFSPPTLIVAPVGAAAVVRKHMPASVVELAVGARRVVGSVTIQATYADHDGRRNKGGPPVPAVGYLLTGSRSVYLAGDTDIFDGMREIADSVAGQRLDVALLPVSGWGLNLGPGHLDAERAAIALTLLRPRVAIPVHWGRLRIPVLWRTRPIRYVTPARDFAEHAAVQAPECQVVIATPGERVEIPPAA
jgi:L-ascorbate metabolism protein UlaG (beta-lactamase superfamily)